MRKVRGQKKGVSVGVNEPRREFLEAQVILQLHMVVLVLKNYQDFCFPVNFVISSLEYTIVWPSPEVILSSLNISKFEE